MDNEKEKQTAKAVERLILNTLLFAGSAFIVKLAWNIGIVSTFTSLTKLTYSAAFAGLLILYIASRVVAHGFLTEIRITASEAVEALNELASKFQQAVKKMKNEEPDYDSSNLN